VASKLLLGDDVYAIMGGSRRVISNRGEEFLSILQRRFFSHIIGGEYIFTDKNTFT